MFSTADPPTRFTRTTVAVLAAAAVVASFASTTEAAKPTKHQKIVALRQRLKAIAQKRTEQRAKLVATKQKQVRLADKLNTSYQQVQSANEALKASEARLHGAKLAVQASTHELHLAQERLRNQQRRFGKRIAYYYKEGPVPYIAVLLGSKDMSQFLDRQYYVSQVMNQDAELLAELRKAQQQVALERQRLLERQAALAAAHRDNADRLAQVQARTAELERLHQAILHERALEEQRLSELEEDSAEVQQSLEKELARRRRALVPRAGGSANLPPFSGRFSMPARGPITSGFGYRYHPILHYQRLHTGLDIGAAYGSGVYAAAPGEVFFASWRGGYGQCIILLHDRGGEVSTLYGHLSKILVRPGQTVRRGQLIGAVGSTGLSTGPHLHFEVRRNGRPVPPM